MIEHKNIKTLKHKNKFIFTFAFLIVGLLLFISSVPLAQADLSPPLRAPDVSLPTYPTHDELTPETKGLKGADELVNIFGGKIGFNISTENPQPEIIVGKIIQGLMLLIGVIFGILVIYGGYMWMIARGNEEYVKKAINILQTAVIGLIITVAAYAITSYVVGKVITATFAP